MGLAGPRTAVGGPAGLPVGAGMGPPVGGPSEARAYGRALRGPRMAVGGPACPRAGPWLGRLAALPSGARRPMPAGPWAGLPAGTRARWPRCPLGVPRMAVGGPAGLPACPGVGRLAALPSGTHGGPA